MYSKDESRRMIAGLVEKYRSQTETFENPGYKEASLRQDFIDKLFAALNWDIGNKQGLAESFREVVIEDRILVDGGNKAADYSFRIGKTVLFYSEIKPPSLNIKNNQEAAFQVRRYGWSNKDVGISILTNCKEWAVYDCTKKPDKNDKPHIGRLSYFTYEDLDVAEKNGGGREDGFEFLWNTFERNNVHRGSLEKYLQEKSDKKGVAAVDDEFLQLLETWREQLAKNVCRNHPDITEDDLNFFVQETLNRIVFLRLAESRLVEPHGNLQKTAAAGDCYHKLYTLFERADEKYNSGLFNFDRDKVSEQIKVDDAVLKTIIKNLYYPSPYEFSQIPVEILGSAYERFLGRTIRLTARHAVKIEAKESARKANGVYYTPQYIVDYMVANTVGELLKEKTPKQAAKIKVLDPACGSGSFLVGAYHFLLDWYRDRYIEEYLAKNTMPKGDRNDTLMPGREPEKPEQWQLTASEKKKILLNNIFGVDIDMIAAEITKLSLLIKCVEGETNASIEITQKIFHEKVLPDIDSNIQNGNSLVDTNFYEFDFDPQDEKKIKPFSWRLAFPDVFKQGGFSVVIGNPPYVRPHRIDANLKPYLRRQYKTFIAKSDLYSCFMERGLFLCGENGLFSFIVPNTWTSLESFEEIRKSILQTAVIKKLTQLPVKVFKQATVATCVFVFQKTEDTALRDKNVITVESLNAESVISAVRTFPQIVIQQAHLHNFQLYGKDEGQSLRDKLAAFEPLEKFVTFKYGFKTGKDEELLSTVKKTAEYKPFIRSGAVKRYYYDKPSEYVLYNPKKMRACTSSARPGEAERFENEKIITAAIGKNIAATYDEGGLYVKDAMLLTRKTDLSLLYILGLLNSKLISYYYREYFVTISILKNALLSIPIKNIDRNNPQEKKSYDEIIKRAAELLRLYRELNEKKYSFQTNHLTQKIIYCEDKINTLVYELYGLTKEEVGLVEKNENVR